MTRDLIPKSSALPLTGSRSYDSALKVINAEAELSPDGLRRYFQFLRDRGLSVATINHKIAAVRKSLKIMAERMGEDSWRARYEIEQMFKSPDFKTVKIERFLDPEDCLSRAELKAVIETADARTSLMIQALYFTACRISELVNVRVTDCEVEGKTVNIYIIGKGRKLRRVYMKLKLYQDITRVWGGKTYLFETRAGKHLDRSNAWRMISKSGHDAGIKRLHPHTLRHTWATLNLPRLGIHKVSRYLGHKEIGTTSKFYLHAEATAEEILQGRLW